MGFRYQDPITGEWKELPDQYLPPYPPGGDPPLPPGTIPDALPPGILQTPSGPTQEQIDAANRGTNFEGRSFGPDEEANFVKDALSKGVPQSWIDSFLARNPHDANRIYEQWYDEQYGDGSGSTIDGGKTGGGGGGSSKPTFAAPPNEVGWMPTLDLPTWQAPDPFKPPPAFEGIGEFHYDPYAAPAPYVPGTFGAPTIEEARNEPGFQFALDEGRRQMEASAAAKGIGRTGGTVKKLIGYGQEMADTNYQNVYNRDLSTFNVNENNKAGAYKTNADIGYQAWSGNQDNALDTFTTNYNTARDKYTTGYTTAKDLWQTAFDSSSFGHTAKTNELIGEFAPKQQEATITHQQAFAEWLAKMGIAQNIFNEGSD